MTRREWARTTATGVAGAILGERAPSAQEAGRGSPAPGRGFTYVHLDVFTNRPLTGNQLAVFLDPAGLDADTMQSMAREVSFSESTFLFPPEAPGTDVRVRIFGRNSELQFAGHPVIGTAFALAHARRLEPGRSRTVFGLGAGPTPVYLDWQGDRLTFAWMTQPNPTFGRTIDDVAGVAAAIGVEPAAIAGTGLPIQEVGCGSTFVYVPLPTRDVVDAAALDGRAIAEVYQRAGMSRRGIMVLSTAPGPDGAQAYTRLLSAGGTEDPATGSAAGPLACYLARHVVSGQQAERMVSLQGFKVRRPSRLHLNITVQGGAITRVRVGGESVVVGEGTIAP